MTLRRRHKSRHSRGFSLVEVVVALTLVSLIMLGLLGALRGIGDTSARLATVSDRVADMRSISDFLRRAFASAASLTYREAGTSESASQAYFRGEADAVRWIAVLPTRFGTRGMHFMRLRVSGEGASKTLWLDYLPYSGAHNQSDWSQVRSHLLLDGVERFDLSYQGADANSPWVQSWIAQDVMPARIRIVLRVAGRYWPELIYALAPI